MAVHATITQSTAHTDARISAGPQMLAQLREQVAKIEGHSWQQDQGQRDQQLPTHPALAEVLQLRAGSSYAVDSASVAIALMAGPSAQGAWSAIVGTSELSLAAAAGAGVVLERTIVVPDPADQWLEVLAALIDSVQLVVLRLPKHVSQKVASRVSARLRSRGCALVVWGQWPRCRAQLSITGSAWHGLGHGHGHLRAREATVAVRHGSAPARTARIWLPDEQQRIRAADQAGENVYRLRSAG